MTTVVHDIHIAADYNFALGVQIERLVTQFNSDLENGTWTREQLNDLLRLCEDAETIIMQEDCSTPQLP